MSYRYEEESAYGNPHVRLELKCVVQNKRQRYFEAKKRIDDEDVPAIRLSAPMESGSFGDEFSAGVNIDNYRHVEDWNNGIVDIPLFLYYADAEAVLKHGVDPIILTTDKVEIPGEGETVPAHPAITCHHKIKYIGQVSMDFKSAADRGLDMGGMMEQFNDLVKLVETLCELQCTLDYHEPGKPKVTLIVKDTVGKSAGACQIVRAVYNTLAANPATQN